MPVRLGGRVIREILMIVFVACSTLGSQLLIKRSLLQLAVRSPDLKGFDWLVAACLSPGVLSAVAIQGLGFVIWVVVVSKVKLGLAFAINGASFYILMAVVSWWLYGERLTPVQWGGIVLVSTGVLMLSSMGQSA